MAENPRNGGGKLDGWNRGDDSKHDITVAFGSFFKSKWAEDKSKDLLLEKELFNNPSRYDNHLQIKPNLSVFVTIHMLRILWCLIEMEVLGNS